MKRTLGQIQVLLLVVIATQVTACFNKESLVYDSDVLSSVSGKVDGVGSFSVHAMACTAPSVSIYTLDGNGVRTGSALATTPVSQTDGSFKLKNLKSKGIDLNSETVSYSLELSGCTENLSRPITGKKDQNISLGTTLIEKVSFVNDPSKKDLPQVNPNDASRILQQLIDISGSSLFQVYNNALLLSSLAGNFQSVFGIPLSSLIDAAPQIYSLNAPTAVAELASANFTLSASHFDPSYDMLIIWKLDGAQVSTNSNYTFTPSQNDQGVHTVQLFLGRDDGSGQIDTSKSYITKTFTLTVHNTYPATVPNVTLTSNAMTNDEDVSLAINTGVLSANCRSFTALAITEDTLVAPINPAEYNIHCTTDLSQTLNYALVDTATQGTRTLRLWAMDSTGNISAAPQVISLTFDTVKPIINSFTINGGTGSSATHFLNVNLQATDNIEVDSYRVSLLPTFSDSDWRPYTDASFTYIAPFSSALRTFYVWVKDTTGNISLVDSEAVNITIGAPPQVDIILPDGNQTWSSPTDVVHVTWKVSSSVGLASTAPIKLYWTADDAITLNDINLNLINGSNGGCVITPPETGCYSFTIPPALVGNGFKLVLRATDVNGAGSPFLSGLLNVSGLKLIAGKMVKLLDGAALSTDLNNSTSANLVVGSNGDIYASGDHAIYKVAAATGNFERVIGTGVATGPAADGTPVTPTTKINRWGESIAIDSLNRLYWIEGRAKVRRIGLDGKIETVIGGGTVVYPPTGTSALSANFSEGAIWSLAMGANDVLYFVYIFGSIEPNPMGAVVYKWTSTDNKLTKIVGDYSYTNPVENEDARNHGFSSKITTAFSTSYNPTVTVHKGSPDLVWVKDFNGNFYQWNNLNYQLKKVYTHDSYHLQAVYDPFRQRLIVRGSSTTIRFVNLADGSYASMNTYDLSSAYGFTVDASGGLYYSTNTRNIFYYGPDSSHARFAGVSPVEGDGGPAVQAQLRLPRDMIVRGSDIYFHDRTNQLLRKVDAVGMLTTIRDVGQSQFFDAGTWTMQLGYQSSPIVDMDTNNCVYLCGPTSATETIANAVSGSSAVGLARNSYEAGVNGQLAWRTAAYDSVRNSFFAYLVDDDPRQILVREVTSSATVIDTLIGQSAVASGNISVGVASNQTLLPHFSLGNSHSNTYHVMQAYNNVVYIRSATSGDGGKVYRIPNGGTTAIEIDANVSSYLVDGPNNLVYWTQGNLLYKKTLNAAGAGTLIKDLKAPFVISNKGRSAHSLLLTTQDFIYEYTDAGAIP